MFDMFQYSFVVRAFVAGGIVGLICPLLGTFLVLRRLSLIADALAHVALTGAALGLLLGQFPVVVAVATTSVAAVALEWLRSTRRLTGDTALALILYSALAITVVLISLGQGFNVNIFGFLFGSIVTVGRPDVWATVALGVVAVALMIVLYSEFVQTTFDPDLAKLNGVRTGRVNFALAVLTGVTITLSMRVVGALLVGALIVFPVLAAMQLRQGFRITLFSAVGVGVLSVLAGLTLSYYQDIAAGGAIVLMALAILIVAGAARALADARARATER